MNVYQKLNKCRLDLQAMNIKKSGKNKFAGYSYFELADILPPINKLFEENSLCAVVSFGTELATMDVIDCDKPDDKITFTSPIAEADLKGCHSIQNIGACETYSRRYLYMTALEIVEADQLDATTGKTTKKTEKPQKEAPVAKPTPPSGKPDYIKIIEDPQNAISKKQMGFIRGKLSDRGIDPEAWKQALKIDHISDISWKCMQDYQGALGLVSQIDGGRFDRLATAPPEEEPLPPEPQQEDIDLDSENPFDEEF